MTKRKAEATHRNSAAAAVSESKALQRGLAQWPATVSRLEDEADRAEVDACFAIIVAQRPADQWTQLDLNRAANLARLMRLLDKDLQTIERVGTLIKGERGVKPNPALYATEKLASQVQQIARSLGLTWQASDPRTKNAANTQFALSHGNRLIDARERPNDGPAKAFDAFEGLN